ncbi:GNAT family N-acetyltransferase [Ekhidna sp.]|uniref:GNAT family N-acetyltransferase n=1 Tax=Ekhidna sp. TaxID=2608089 RepID=UPI003B50F58C
MSIQIKEVTSKKDLKKFIKFPFELYEGNKYYVPPMVQFEMSTLLRDKNPAFENADAKYWVAVRDDKIVGRVAAIALDLELKEKKLARFGWIDFIDDKTVSGALISTVEEWSKHKGAEAIHGPMGFTDLDFEGTLISGFEQMATQASIYNFPYYQEHFESLGFEKTVDWIEKRGHVPKEIPKRYERLADVISKRFGIKALKLKKAKDVRKYAEEMFKVLNESYSHLYGYYELTPKQIDYYVEQYLGMVRKEYICLVVDEKDKIIGVAVSFPSLSKAFQKAKGSLFPFGFIHILKDFKSNKHLDLLLIGVKPEYQKKGVTSLIFNELFKSYIENGAEYFSTGPMLEDNATVQNLWNEYNDILDDVNIKRRCYQKIII